MAWMDELFENSRFRSFQVKRILTDLSRDIRDRIYSSTAQSGNPVYGSFFSLDDRERGTRFGLTDACLPPSPTR